MDASFTNEHRQGSTGVVLRDHAGKLIRGQAIWYEHAHCARTMEALAIRDGTKLAADLGFRRVIIESDAEVVVKLWNSACFDRADVAPICHEITALGEGFESFALVHARREANIAAHKCAKQATEERKRCIWVNFIPSFLRDCIQNFCYPSD